MTELKQYQMYIRNHWDDVKPLILENSSRKPAGRLITFPTFFIITLALQIKSAVRRYRSTNQT